MKPQTKKDPKRRHTPVWQVIWSVRPRLKRFAIEPDKALKSAPVPVMTAPAKPPTEPKYWAKKVGVDLAMLPLKLLHILVVGYQPKRKKPKIVWV